MNEALKPSAMKFAKAEVLSGKVMEKYMVENFGCRSKKSSYACGIGWWKSIMSG